MSGLSERFKLNDRIVPEGMYNRAQTVRRNGGRIFLVIDDFYHEDKLGQMVKDVMRGRTFCANCEGIGRLFLQIITGGPYPSPDGRKHVTRFEDSWYVQETIDFICPVCNGAGLHARQAARAD